MDTVDTELDWSDVNTLKQHWAELDHASRLDKFFKLPRIDQEDLFLGLSPDEQIEMVMHLGPAEKRGWIRILALDDAADFVQRLPQETRGEVLCLLDDVNRQEVMGLMAYAEDEAGGVMNPRYI